MKKKPAPGAEMGEVENPTPGPDDVLIKIRAASVCGTDLHIFHWNPWAASRLKPPIVFGHECAGEVVEVGSRVRDMKVGTHVSVETHIACEKCFQCIHGQEHLCRDVEIVGVDRSGAFAEYLVIPARNAWRNDSTLSWEIATILEPFGNSVHSIQAVGGAEGKSLFVSGCGPIGLMAILAAKAEGATKIYAADTNAYRVEMASRLGVTAAWNATKSDVRSEVMEATHGLGVDAVLEMSGAAPAIETGLAVARNGGGVSLLGLPSGPVKIDLLQHVILKGTEVHGIFGRRMFDTWEKERDLIEKRGVDLSPIITHRYGLEQFTDALATLESGQCGKLVFQIP